MPIQLMALGVVKKWQVRFHGFALDSCQVCLVCIDLAFYEGNLARCRVGSAPLI